MLNMLINILQPTHPDDIKSWLVYAPERGTEFFFLLKYWTYMYLDLVRLVVFLHHQQKKKNKKQKTAMKESLCEVSYSMLYLFDLSALGTC